MFDLSPSVPGHLAGERTRRDFMIPSGSGEFKRWLVRLVKPVALDAEKTRRWTTIRLEEVNGLLGCTLAS